MPRYTFEIENSRKTVEIEMSKEEYLDRMGDDGWLTLPDGRRGRQPRVFRPGFGKTQRPSTWPQESLAFGCFPEQIPHHVKWYRERGVNMEYRQRPDGTCRAVFRSRGHRRAADMARGFFDADAGYGDATK